MKTIEFYNYLLSSINYYFIMDGLIEGILGLCQYVQMSSIDIKLELVRKLLTIVYSHSQASTQISKQTGWEGCISR